MASSQPPPTPIQIHIPPTLQRRTISLAKFLQTHPQYSNLAVGSFIFWPASSHKLSSTASAAAPLLLIVRRAATERAFPNLWEVPGGSAELTDPTILHSAARETFEETGLKLTRFVREIGEGVEFVCGSGSRAERWAKLHFEIEVQEMEERGCVEAKADPGTEVNGDAHPAAPDLTITLDPEEHQEYAWAKEADIEAGRYAMVTPEHYEVVMQAFALRRTGKSE